MRVILFAVWTTLLIAGLVFIARYALTNPFVDEWEFVPVLFQERPAGPWLWELHNEHRFPLPRLLYISLFRLTGDLRVGCVVSLLGVSLLALGLMRLAREVRGHASVLDAVFPLLLMHVGQGENLYMGYQLCFMLMTVLAGILLAVIVRTRRNDPDHFRPAMYATLLGWLLLTCGAGGLAYGVAAAGWVAILATLGSMSVPRRCLLLAFLTATPLYIALYFQGYVRPDHHPPSAGAVESLRIALQAQSMALGPAATGLWPAIGVAILLVGLLVLGLLLRMTVLGGFDLRAAGLLLFVLAGGAVVLGIGWGRSGFHNNMGMAWRYGWIAFPSVAAAYLTWLRHGGRVAIYGTGLLFATAALFAPINEISGFLDAEQKVRAYEQAWEADVRAGLSADEVVDRRFPANQFPEGFRRLVADDMRLMRDHGYTYYASLGRENP